MNLKTTQKLPHHKVMEFIKTRLHLLFDIFYVWYLDAMYTIQIVHLKACNQDVNMQVHARLNRII